MIERHQPTGSGALTSPGQSAPFDWHRLLLPGETLLWQGRPREGAGWRCLLRHFGLEEGLLATVAVFAALPLLVFLLPGWGLTGLLILASLGTGVAAIHLAVGGRRLRYSQYAITDRRALVLRARPRAPRRIIALSHDEMMPRLSHSICGVTIKLGLAEVTEASVEGRASLRGRITAPVEGLPIFGDMDGLGGDDDEVTFAALDPETAPIHLIHALATGRDPQDALRRQARAGSAPS